MMTASQPFWLAALAELIIGFGSISALVIGLFSSKNAPQRSFKVVFITLLVALFALFSQDTSPQLAFEGMFIQDAFSIGMREIILLIGLTVLLLTRLTTTQEGLNQFEYPILILLALMGMMVALSAHDLLSLFLGIELQSLSSYALVGMRRKNADSSEAALKYFLLGALSTGILLYGCSLLYGATGLTNFTNLSRFFNLQSLNDPSLMACIGLIFVTIALSFKLALAPFHLWSPDVYQGTPTSLTVFLATAPKVTALAVLMRLLLGPFATLAPIWQPLLIGLIITSLLMGSLAALNQLNLKRLLAYSSISHVGFASLGIVTTTQNGLSAAIGYSVFYVTMTILFFGGLLYLSRQGKPIETIRDLKGVGQSHPTIACLLGFSLLSMAGIPPFPGFLPKLWILQTLVAKGSYWLVLVALLYSIIAAAYYLKLLQALFLDKSEDLTPLQGRPLARKHMTSLGFVLLAIGIGLALTLVSPLAFLEQIKHTAQALLP